MDIIKTFIDDSSVFFLFGKMRDGDQSEFEDTKYAFNEHSKSDFLTQLTAVYFQTEREKAKPKKITISMEMNTATSICPSVKNYDRRINSFAVHFCHHKNVPFRFIHILMSIEK